MPWWGFGGCFGFGRGRGWRRMYYATGLPGWVRYGYPGWAVPAYRPRPWVSFYPW